MGKTDNNVENIYSPMVISCVEVINSKKNKIKRFSDVTANSGPKLALHGGKT